MDFGLEDEELLGEEEESVVVPEVEYFKPKKYRVLVTNPDIPGDALANLREVCEVHMLPCSGERLFIRYCQGMDGLLLDDPSIKLDREFFRGAGVGLKVVSLVGWNGDQIDMKEALKRKIRVGVCPSDLAVVNAAEVAMGLALALCRRMKEGNNSLIRNTAKLGCPAWLLGQDLKNCVCGIIGLGKLGTSIAMRLQGFEPVKMVYYSRRVKRAGIKLGIKRVLFDELLEMSDVIFLCLPCNENTRGIINEENFIKMKRCSILINPSHGGLIKMNDLYCALRKGLIFAAGVDSEVSEAPSARHPIHRLDNFILLPSLGRNSALVKLRMNIAAVDNIISGLIEKKMKFPLKTESSISIVETEEERIIRVDKDERLRKAEDDLFDEAEHDRLQKEDQYKTDIELEGINEEQTDEEGDDYPDWTADLVDNEPIIGPY